MPLRTVCGLIPKSADSSLVDGMPVSLAYEPVKNILLDTLGDLDEQGDRRFPVDVHAARSSLLVSYLSN